MLYRHNHLSLFTMKKWYILPLIVLFCMPIGAQENKKQLPSKTEKTDTVTFVQPHTAGASAQPLVNGYLPALPTTDSDSLHLPTLNLQGQMMSNYWYPYYGTGWYGWDLHQGLNVNLGASVFGFIGKNAPSGAGFTQSVSAMYAMPLNKNLSLAVGGYLNRLRWSHQSYHDAGLSAVLGYRFNERWEAYLYGQKSLYQTMPMFRPLYDMTSMGDRLGAAVKYHFNPSFSIQLSVERGWMPNSRNTYFDQYNYPVPK